MTKTTTDLDLNCRARPRLASFLNENGKEYPDYRVRACAVSWNKEPGINKKINTTDV